MKADKIRKMRVFADGKWNCYINEKWIGLQEEKPEQKDIRNLYQKCFSQVKEGEYDGEDNRKSGETKYSEIAFDLSKPSNLNKLLCEETKKRFWEKVDRKGKEECWEWQKDQTDYGYGRMSVDNQVFLANRLSYIINHEEHPGEEFVLHKCDNPPCVNPHHLYLGDYSDNIKDAYERGRRESLSGNNSPIAKINSEDAEEIRKMYDGSEMTQKEIGDIYGITARQVSSIVNDEVWT